MIPDGLHKTAPSIVCLLSSLLDAAIHTATISFRNHFGASRGCAFQSLRIPLFGHHFVIISCFSIRDTRKSGVF